MRKFVKLIKLFPWLFPKYKIYVNVLPRISVLYFMFDLLLPFMDRYFFVQHIFSAECTIGMVWGLTALKHYGTKALRY